MPLLCNRCFRTTAEDMDNCPSKDSYLPCPPPVEVSDDKVVIVTCAACPKTRAIPIGNIMQRKRLSELGPCLHDQCKAVVVLPTVTRPSTPPPISDEALVQNVCPVCKDDAAVCACEPEAPPVAAQPKRRRVKRGKGK